MPICTQISRGQWAFAQIVAPAARPAAMASDELMGLQPQLDAANEALLCAAATLLLQLRSQQFHDSRVGQGDDVADLAVLGHVAEQPAHDLCRTGSSATRARP